MPIVLRPIALAVAVQLRAARLAALLDTPTAFGSTHARESAWSEDDWRRRADEWSSARAAGYLAFDGEDLAGIAVGVLDADGPSKANLISMWVAPAYRRRGVGRLLVDAVGEWAVARVGQVLHLMVTSDNDAAARFYDRLGFVPTGRNKPYPNDPALTLNEMSRPLRPTPAA